MKTKHVFSFILSCMLAMSIASAQDATYSIGMVDEGSNAVQIMIDSPGDIYGFQFQLSGATAVGAGGGMAQSAGFITNVGGGTVIGFTLMGIPIPAGSGVLINVQYANPIDPFELCVTNAVLSGANGAPYTIIYGDCYTAPVIIPGCMDPNATNYNPDATLDDGSCEYPQIVGLRFGSFDPIGQGFEILVDNEGPEALFGFQFNVEGATLNGAGGGLAAEYGFTVTASEQTVLGFSFGGGNIPPGPEDVLTNVGYLVDPVRDMTFCLAEAVASGSGGIPLTVEMGPCVTLGCTDPNADNYSPNAGIDDGSCIYPGGCTNPEACNYDEFATFDDGSCLFDDCNGDCGGVAFYDECDQCVGGQTGMEADWAKDDCGVCFGDNANMDCNEECFGNAVYDDCQNCVEGSTGMSYNWAMDCNEECYGTAVYDDCDMCTGGSTGLMFNYSLDCNGECGGDAYFDDCQQCVGGSTGMEFNWAMDCNDDCFGSASYDNCDVCSGGLTGLLPNADIDDCGICFGDNEAKDCNGECFGNAVFDDCQNCVEGSTGMSYNWAMDCNEECFGTAVYDDCDMCTGGSTGLPFNYTMDCNNECGGDAYFDDCQQCVGGSTGVDANWAMDCLEVCFGDAVIDECGICDGNGIPAGDCDCYGNVYDCNDVCGGGAEYDECGVCDGNGIPAGDCDCYGNVYDCNDVCGGGAEYDECGVCDGNGIPAGDCDCNGNVYDCLEVCGGDAEYDECGVCDGNGIPAGDCDCYGNVYDCNDVCGGGAVIDDCGVCGGMNEDMDCAGNCFGDALILTYWWDFDGDGLGAGEPFEFCSSLVEEGFVDNNDDPEPFCPTNDTDDCGVCGGNNESMDCAGVCGGNSVEDVCGVCGGNGSSCNTPVNFVMFIETNSGTPVVFQADGHLNPNDPDGGVLAVHQATNPRQGSRSIAGMQITYTPAAGYSGSDYFYYKVRATDASGTFYSYWRKINIIVHPVNQPPVAQSRNVTTPEDVAKNITLMAMDPDGDVLSYFIDSPPLHGTLTGTGSVRVYTPFLNYNGPDSFTFHAQDAEFSSNVATVSINVSPVNDPPVAVPAFIPITNGGIFDLAPFVNDPDGDLLAFSWQPINMTTFTGLGSVTPVGGTLFQFNNLFPLANDWILFRASDGIANSQYRLITFILGGRETRDMPLISPPELTLLQEDGSGIVTILAFDSDGGFFEVAETEITNDVDFGTLTPMDTEIIGGGIAAIFTYEYTPEPNYNGLDSFDATATSGHGTSPFATEFPFSVTPVEDQPELLPIADRFVDEDGVLELTVTVANPDNFELDVTLESSIGSVAVGQVIRESSIDLVITPDPDYFGSAVITVDIEAIGEQLYLDSESFTVTVNPIPDAPVVDPIAAQQILEDESDVFYLGASDADGDSDFTFFAESGNTSLVQVTVDGDELTFLPQPDQFGTTTITITAEDGTSRILSEPVVFDLTVENVNDAPMIITTAPADQLSQGQLFSYQVGVEDIDSENFFFELSGAPAGMEVSEAGLITWLTDASGSFGPITVEVTDDGDPVGQDSENFFVHVDPLDCAGVPNGEAVQDDCGVCAGGTTGNIPNADKDCSGECFGTKVVDDCDDCVEPGSFNAAMDCNDECDGTAAVDDCGVCAGGSTGLDADADKDCSGECFGTKVVDDCDDCVEPGSFNAAMDCNDECDGTAFIGDCGCVEGSTGLEADFCYGCLDPEAINYNPDATILEECVYQSVGDVNGNGSFNIADIVYLVYLIINSVEPTPEQLAAGDVYPDGMLTILDIVTLVDILVNSVGRTDPVSFVEIVQNAYDVKINADGVVAGIELNVSGDFVITNTALNPGWEVFYSDSKIIMISLDHSELTTDRLFEYSGEMVIEEAVVADWNRNAVTSSISHLPEEYVLMSAYPNPFNPATTITYSVPERSLVKVAVMNMAGQQVAELVNSNVEAGSYSITWNASNVPSGVYLIQMVSGNHMATSKVVLLK